MICKEVHKKMNSYLSEELSASQIENFESHLRDCASCDQLLNEVKLTMSMSPQSKSLEADPYMFTRIQAKIDKRAERKSSWQKVVQPVAISLFILFGVFAGVNLGSKYYTESIASTQEYVEDSEIDDIYFDVLAYESIENLLLTEN